MEKNNNIDKFIIRPSLPCSWSTSWGEDNCGLWTEFEIRGVVQRMRWIIPGVFLMGSTPQEPERFDDETQHEVKLTRGFWFADTVCTQELWNTVMENNPSRFQGDQRPVDSICYDDCMKFIKKINEVIDGLELRLPTEAEWEYACRAKTETPFWFGSNINKSQVNFNKFHPYNDSEKTVLNEYDPETPFHEFSMFWQETADVKAFPHNSWGLYQMHGNVREWCADWYGAYEIGRIVDPQGPTSGDTRVLRGGCWYSRGRGCRSARRFSKLPHLSEDTYGFRFCRNQ